jgi:hypothetical protein
MKIRGTDGAGRTGQASPHRAPDLDVKLRAFVEEAKTDAVNFFLNNPWTVRSGLRQYDERLDADLAKETFAFLKRGRCRMLDYGAGEARLFDDLKEAAAKSDRAHGTALVKAFRGIAVDLSDYRLIRAYEGWLSKTRGIRPEREQMRYYGPGSYGKEAIRSFVDHPGLFEEFKRKRLLAGGLGAFGNYIHGDIRDIPGLEPNRLRVQMAVSMGTLHYVPDAIRIVEDLYNNRLVMGGKAFLEIDGREYLEFRSPRGSVGGLGGLVQAIQGKDDFGIRLKDVRLHGTELAVMHIHKTAPHVDFASVLCDLRPFQEGRRQPTNAVKVYNTTVEF